MYYNIFMLLPSTEESQQSLHCWISTPYPWSSLHFSLQKTHFQYIITTRIKNQVLKKTLGRKGDLLPLNQNTKGRQLIIAERLVCLKRNKSQKRQHPSNTSLKTKSFQQMTLSWYLFISRQVRKRHQSWSISLHHF